MTKQEKKEKKVSKSVHWSEKKQKLLTEKKK